MHEGPAIVRRSSAGGHRIFLDLKLHDIPDNHRLKMAATGAGAGLRLRRLHIVAYVPMRRERSRLMRPLRAERALRDEDEPRGPC